MADGPSALPGAEVRPQGDPKGHLEAGRAEVDHAEAGREEADHAVALS